MRDSSETPKPIELKFGMIDYVQHTTRQAKSHTRRFSGIGWGSRDNGLCIHGERGARPFMGVWRRSLQRGPGAEPGL